MSEKLRPCPFCGSEVQDDERGEKYPKKSPMGGWIIHCECCGASLSQFRKSGKDEISWNTRPIEDMLTARIAELEAEIDQLTAHSDIERQDDKWIPVSERLPEDLQSVVIITNDSMTGIVRYLELYGREGFGAWSEDVTHWMPLPSAPEVQE